MMRLQQVDAQMLLAILLDYGLANQRKFHSCKLELYDEIMDEKDMRIEDADCVSCVMKVVHVTNFEY